MGGLKMVWTCRTMKVSIHSCIIFIWSSMRQRKYYNPIAIIPRKWKVKLKKIEEKEKMKNKAEENMKHKLMNKTMKKR